MDALFTARSAMIPCTSNIAQNQKTFENENHETGGASNECQKMRRAGILVSQLLVEDARWSVAPPGCGLYTLEQNANRNRK